MKTKENHSPSSQFTHPMPKDGSMTEGVYDRPVSFLVMTSILTWSGVRLTTVPQGRARGADPEAARPSRRDSAPAWSSPASASVTALASFLNAMPSTFLSGTAVRASTVCVVSNFSKTVRSAFVAAAWAVRS